MSHGLKEAFSQRGGRFLGCVKMGQASRVVNGPEAGCIRPPLNSHTIRWLLDSLCRASR